MKQHLPPSAPWQGHRLQVELVAVHYALHDLWTAAVGMPGYDKAAWRRLRDAIDELARVSQ